MLVISSREFRENQKKFMDLAAIQRVIIKRRNQFFELIARGTEIPDSISPSNDPYFNERRNVDRILEASDEARSGRKQLLTDDLMKDLFE